nr:serine hydrolase [uncultured Erythrobacter sp.]
MIRMKIIFATAALTLSISATTSVSAQSAQERLDARYDRALAAGYKALFLCSATANAELNGATRTPEGIHQWELSGIQEPLNEIIRDLPYEIVRSNPERLRTIVARIAARDGVSVEEKLAEFDPAFIATDASRLRYVKVEWAEDMEPRIANHHWGNGCVLMPIGWKVATMDPGMDVPPTQPYVQPLSPIEEPSMPSLEAGSAAFDGKTYGEGSRTTAVLVMHENQSMFERYADGFGPSTPQRTWSVAKSLAATLVGYVLRQCPECANEPGAITTISSGQEQLAEQGWPQLDRGLVLPWTPSAVEPRREITVDHFLRMASGRYSDTAGNRTDPLYWGGTTVAERAANWPIVHKPGTVYRYSNNDTLMAIWAFRDWLEENPPQQFFELVGMRHTVAESDWQGNYVLSSQAWTTSRDLAKLGQLYLNDGVLPDGTRVLPEGWVKYVSDPSGPQPAGTQWGYGAGWWTFRRPEGNAFEGIPDDAFAARGNRGQYVVVVPSRNVVIVRRGEDMVGTRFDIAAFTRDVLAALDE